MGRLNSLKSRYGAANYQPLPVTLVRGEGAYVWDKDGRRYLDLMGAYSAASFGHSHPRLVEAMTLQAKRSTRFRAPISPIGSGRFSPAPASSPAWTLRCPPMAAPSWSRPRSRRRVNGPTPSRACRAIVPRSSPREGNFHGRSTTIVGFSSTRAVSRRVWTICSGIQTGSVRRRRRARGRHHARHRRFPGRADPGRGRHQRAAPRLPGEGREPLSCARRTVDLRRDPDRAWRHARMLACQHDGVTPDGVILGKALGGGLIPVSLFSPVAS